MRVTTLEHTNRWISSNCARCLYWLLPGTRTRCPEFQRRSPDLDAQSRTSASAGSIESTGKSSGLGAQTGAFGEATPAGASRLHSRPSCGARDHTVPGWPPTLPVGPRVLNVLPGPAGTARAPRGTIHGVCIFVRSGCRCPV